MQMLLAHRHFAGIVYTQVLWLAIRPRTGPSWREHFVIVRLHNYSFRWLVWLALGGRTRDTTVRKRVRCLVSISSIEDCGEILAVHMVCLLEKERCLFVGNTLTVTCAVLHFRLPPNGGR